MARKTSIVTGWKAKPWTTLRKAIQTITLVIFIALFVASRHGGWSPTLVNIPMRLDPLAVLANLLASRTFLAGSYPGDPGHPADSGSRTGLVRLALPSGHAHRSDFIETPAGGAGFR